MSTQGITVACHVRTSLFLEPVDAKVETLRQCEDEGTLEGLVLRTWPDQIRLDEDSPFQEAIEVYERYALWADRRDYSIEPPFRIKTARSMASEEEWDVLVTPILCLGIYRGSELVGVFPHSDGETVYGATDAIAALRSGELPPPVQEEHGATSVRYTEPGATTRQVRACPRCSASAVNVHGILACTDCRWTAVERVVSTPRP